ncbi:hypothetical protein [Isoptericola variabilis]|uniref:hypothetical protein n=1 Tax=Isoptericola variabilis TaxID=139208 RepID=UPI000303D5E4|nr:hypothetical protein [Isoptericola variabilis]
MACAATVRRDAFLASGGFDDVVRFPGEEERLAWDLAADGFDLVHVPDVVVHHHPSPRRHDAAARRRAVARSRTLSAVLRLPWRDVGRRLGEDLRAGGPERRGVLAAAADLLPALRRRRTLPEQVLADLAVLATQPVPRPADTAGVPSSSE